MNNTKSTTQANNTSQQHNLTTQANNTSQQHKSTTQANNMPAQSPRGSPPVPLTAATMETLRLLLDALGEVAVEECDELAPALLPLLRAPSAQLRVQAAATLAALAAATHARAAQLLRACIAELKPALHLLGQAGAPGGRRWCTSHCLSRGAVVSLQTCGRTGVASNGVAARVDALACVHGAAFAISTLVCATTKCVACASPLRRCHACAAFVMVGSCCCALCHTSSQAAPVGPFPAACRGV